MIVKIDKLSHDFRGITKLNGKICFVSNAIPDEIVDIRIIKDKKNMCEGKVDSYISKSENRVNSICPYYNECGGCDTSHIKYFKQLQYKKDIVKDIMKKYAFTNIDMEIVPSISDYGYRNKISLKVYNEKLSLVKEASNDFVNIEKCFLANDNINRVINIIGDLSLDKVSEVIIRGINDIMVIFKGEINQEEVISALKEDVSSIILNNIAIFGDDYITVNVNNFKYAVYPQSFFQINTDMIEKLYDKVSEYAGKEYSLLDLYCGAGTIGIYLANNFTKVRGIEVNEDAIRSANINKDINGISNIKFECKKVSDINKIVEDVIVVDPPRSGLDNTTIKKIMDSSTKRIVYVSCNPITLARDINILKDRFVVKEMTLFDMFPNTKHVECVCMLNRR